MPCMPRSMHSSMMVEGGLTMSVAQSQEPTRHTATDRNVETQVAVEGACAVGSVAQRRAGE